MPTDTARRQNLHAQIQRGPEFSMKKIIAILSLLAAIALPASAMAAGHCKYYNGRYGPEVNGPFRYTFNTAAITINPNVADGDLLAPTQTISLSRVTDADGNPIGGQAWFKCDVPIATVRYEVTSGPQSAFPNVFNSAIPGVGIRMSFTTGTTTPGPWPQSYSYGSARETYINTGVSLVLEFVKTGPVTLGGTIDSDIGRWFATGPGESIVGIGPSTPIIIVPNIPTCSVSTPDVQVNLVAAEAANLPNVNDTLNEKDFKVTMACSGGDPGTKTAMWMSLTDQTTSTNVTDKLSLTPASTATGVALQILRNGAPINFNPTVNRFKVQDVFPGISTVDIPFKARYIRTSDPIRPGRVQGIATFTVEYL